MYIYVHKFMYINFFKKLEEYELRQLHSLRERQQVCYDFGTWQHLGENTVQLVIFLPNKEILAENNLVERSLSRHLLR